jgi:glycosyltransferase involved in cell wall biosynthesis
MPTADRRAFVPRAIEYFLRQDYPHKELIILDDGSEAVADLVPETPEIHYERLPQSLSIGAKRNLACERARGEVIVHWDDDDWHAPWRLTYQVAELVRAKADLCGLSRTPFYEAKTDRAWQHVYSGSRPWVCAGTMVFTKTFSQRNRFPNLNVGEDTQFVWATTGTRVAMLENPDFYVAMIHPANTSPKRSV